MALVEEITWSIPPDLPEVEILTVKNNQRPWYWFHETYTVCNIDNFVDDDGRPRPAGAAEWNYRAKTYLNPARTLMLLEPGETHRNRKAPPMCNFSVALFDTRFVNRIATESGLHPDPHFTDAVASDPAVYRAFVRFHAVLAEQSTLLHRQSLMVQCVGSLLTRHCEKKLRPPLNAAARQLRWARDFLHQHYAEKISLDQLADIAGLSRFHFLRAFSSQFGQPPHSYQLVLRTERVRQLIKRGIPLHAIEAGFADQSHLIRHFKRTLGVTPSQYVAMMGMKSKGQSQIPSTNISSLKQ